MNALQRLLSDEGAFVTPESVLEDLNAEDARAHPCGAPHSLYEELWHIDFWQHWTLAVVKGQEVNPPLRASDGWPTDNETFAAEAWVGLNDRFLRELKEVTALAGSRRLGRRVGDEALWEHIETIAGQTLTTSGGWCCCGSYFTSGHHPRVVTHGDIRRNHSPPIMNKSRFRA